MNHVVEDLQSQVPGPLQTAAIPIAPASALRPAHLPVAAPRSSFGDKIGMIYVFGVVAFTLIKLGETSWLPAIGWGLIWPVFIVKWGLDIRRFWSQ